MKYIQAKKVKNCIFCAATQASANIENLVVVRGQRCFGMLNLYPYTSGHIMIVPDDHVAGLFQLDQSTRNELIELTSQATEVLGKVYQPEGFNIGMNIGQAGGAGIAEHLHVHVIPRWSGDTNFMTSVAETRVFTGGFG